MNSAFFDKVYELSRIPPPSLEERIREKIIKEATKRNTSYKTNEMFSEQASVLKKLFQNEGFAVSKFKNHNKDYGSEYFLIISWENKSL